MMRWHRLLDEDLVRSLVRHRAATGTDEVRLDIGPVELLVTRWQAMYFIPRFLVDEFEDLDVSFCVR